MKKIIFSFLPALVFLFASCKNDKREPVAKGEGSNIYFDYEINGEEGFDKLTILARFRDGGQSDNTITLQEPAKLELDGELFPVDSAGLSGTFYELNKPLDSFAGKHIITFTDNDKKTYDEEFEFAPMRLDNPTGDTLRRGNISFKLTGIDENEFVRVIMTDTTFLNEGVNKRFAVINGQINLSAIDLNKLADGPVQLELIKEENHPVKDATELGGSLKIRYVIRRSFFLTE